MVKNPNNADLNENRGTNALKFNPGCPNECEQHSRCPDCEYLLQCAEDDSAWTDDSLEEVRMLAFASSIIQIRSYDKTKEKLFLSTFKTRITAELSTCTTADMEWAKNALEARRNRIEELERKFEEELYKIKFEDSDVETLSEYAKRIDRYCGPIMTDEEFWETIRKAEKRFFDGAK